MLYTLPLSNGSLSPPMQKTVCLFGPSAINVPIPLALPPHPDFKTPDGVHCISIAKCYVALISHQLKEVNI